MARLTARPFAAFLIVILGAVVPAAALEPVDVTFYELLKWPERFDGKIVRVKATLVGGYEKQALKDPCCVTEIWLETNERPEAIGAEYAFIKGPKLQKDDRPQWTRFRNPIRVNSDAAWETLSEARSAHYCNDAGQPDWRMPKFRVSATFTGRFDHRWTRFRAVRASATGEIEIRPGGFGHLRMYGSQLALQAVSDVVATPIDRASYDGLKIN